MSILIAILLILNLSATIYFVGVLHERSQKLKRPYIINSYVGNDT